MKLHVVFGKDGEILGAAQLDGDAPVRARPMGDEKAGHRAADVYVPAEYQHYDLAAVCQRLRVDVRAKFPELKAADDPAPSRVPGKA
jgi:hypothetical protein